MTVMTTSLRRRDKLAKLKEPKTQASFLHGFSCFKQINRVCRFDGVIRNLAKMTYMYSSMSK